MYINMPIVGGKNTEVMTPALLSKQLGSTTMEQMNDLDVHGDIQNENTVDVTTKWDGH